MKKYVPGILEIVIFTLSFIAQDILSNYVDLNNLFIDFISFLIIFTFFYILFSPLRNKYK